MMKKFFATILTATLVISTFSGCGDSSQESAAAMATLSVEADTKEAEDAAKTAEEAAASKAAEEEAARQEEANTCYEQGRACLYGLNGQEIDLEAAYSNFVNALELGKTEANFYLGILCDWYNYPEQDYEKALAYYEAAGDDPYAQLALGYLYYNGHGVEKDRAKAQEMFDAVIAEGCVEGYLGSADVAAEDVEDFDTAFEYFNKALEGEEQIYIASASYDIGYMYRYGLGVEQDYAQAMEWFEESADLGYPTAMNTIGYMYDCGEGVEQDYTKAMEWYIKAADLGNSNAMANIAWMYENGNGVKQDYTKALEWYTKAADLGSTASMNNIGWLYENGYGVEQDYTKALEWYMKAADSGDTTSMRNIGYYYENGLGVEKDSKKAQEWYDKAAAAE